KSSNEKTPGPDFTSQYRFSPGFRAANASAHFPAEYGADFGIVVGTAFAARFFAAIRLRDAGLDRLQHRVRERVYLVERVVHVRRDADAVELGVPDGRRHDPVIVVKPAAELAEVEAVHVEQADRTALVRAEGREDFHAIARREQAARPAVS